MRSNLIGPPWSSRPTSHLGRKHGAHHSPAGVAAKNTSNPRSTQTSMGRKKPRHKAVSNTGATAAAQSSLQLRETRSEMCGISQWG